MSNNNSTGGASNPATGVNSMRLFTPLSTQTLMQQTNVNPAHPVDNRLQQGVFQSVTSDNNPQSIQQRMFGMLNEAGTNVTHVPTTLAAPGQSFTFQHARFALSGAELSQMLAQQGSGRVNALSSVLNHPGLNPIYRPDFYGVQANGSSAVNGVHPHGVMASINNPTTLHFPISASSNGYVPNFTSITAQRLPKVANTGFPSSAAASPMYAAYGTANTIWPQHFMGPSTTRTSEPNHSGQGTSVPRASGQPQLQRKVSKRSASDEEEGMGRKKRKKRDPTLPTPARFAWNFYFRDQYTKIRNSEPSEHNNVQRAFTEIGLDLGKKWKSLTKEEKEPYVKMAALDKERYEREMQQRFSGGGMAPSATSSASGTGEVSSDGEESEKVDEEEEKVGIVLHEIEVEDKRSDSEKAVSAPTEGQLVADVLIVDDDEVFLKIVRHKLVVGQKHPPRILTVTSASDAKRMIVDENKKFGTILLDKDFGEGNEDGISSLQVIREKGYQGVVVGVTGSADDETKSQFTESGANNTFVKGTSNFYDDLIALVKLHSKNVKDMEQSEENAQHSEVANATMTNPAVSSE